MKSWLLVLNYKCPNKYFKHTKSWACTSSFFFIFANLLLFTTVEKLVTDFPEKKVLTKRYLLPVFYRITEMQENFAFSAHFDIIYPKTLIFSFVRTQ